MRILTSKILAFFCFQQPHKLNNSKYQLLDVHTWGVIDLDLNIFLPIYYVAQNIFTHYWTFFFKMMMMMMLDSWQDTINWSQKIIWLLSPILHTIESNSCHIWVYSRSRSFNELLFRTFLRTQKWNQFVSLFSLFPSSHACLEYRNSSRESITSIKAT